MTNELAHELKAAGFPQRANAQYQVETTAYIPTLSELIEACETDLYALQRWGNGWRAIGLRALGNVPKGFGSSPEEAVARLWIALNFNSI